ncbi:50S ribosomal protein L29 [bacterium]|nr:50S ribosomal protein L29 [bacterium]MCK4597722.1 50S ribosomal protein L29 [bacterium]
MKPERIREKTDGELIKLRDDLQEELFNLRFQLVSRQLDNPLRIRLVRRDLARVKSIMQERHLEKEKQASQKGEGV